MYFGGDYYPEQWPEDVWVQDIALMQEAKVNLVSVGVFAWSKLQPAEDRYDFDWLDRVIDLLHEGGIAVNLATATASPPQWATHSYPGILPEDENGSRYWPGSRQHYAPTSPDYRRLASELVSQIATRYAKHPAVVMWHVNNEYGCHVHYDYSDNAAIAFRLWLQSKYETVDRLNTAWGTNFWSQTYSTFEEVLPPRKTPTFHNPGGMLDFRRFSSDALLELFKMEKSIIRSAGATQPVTTNFMGAFAPLDYRKWANEVDIVSDDSYPDPADPESFRISAFSYDLMRSLKPAVPWMVMEQATNGVNWRPSNAVKAPGQMEALSMQAIARGANGIMYFQWRQSVAGSEKFHSAMLPHAGTATKPWSELVQLGSHLAELPEPIAPQFDADVAIVLDWDNWWAIDQPDHPVDLDYLKIVQAWYNAFHRANIQVDIIGTSDDLSKYRAVIAPCLYSLSESAARRLIDFVSNGGHLVGGPFTDLVDESARFRDGGFMVLLSPVFGAKVVDFSGLTPETPIFELGTELFEAESLVEELRLVSAQTWATYVSGPFAGGSAITVNNFGSGRAYYCSTIPGSPGLDEIVGRLTKELGVEPTLSGLPATVEAIRHGSLLTLINHSPQPTSIFLPAGLETLAGALVRLERLRLQPFEVVTYQFTDTATESPEGAPLPDTNAEAAKAGTPSS